MARGVSHMAAPILSPLQLRCLLALSFVDRQFIVVQDVTAVLFPRAERVFRKVDELVLLMESLPVRFDGAVDGLEVFVAGVKSGVRGLVPKRCCRADVFRDIRCDEEEGALHRAVADDVRAMEKRCEDVTRKVESVEVVTVDGGGGDDGGTGDRRRTTGVGSAEKIIGDTEHDEKIDHDAVQGAYEKATRPETEEQEVSCANTARTLKGESQGDANPMKSDAASGGEECAEVLKRDGGAVEVVETHTAEIMEAMQSTEIVETQEAASREGGSSEREEVMSMSSRQSKQDALLDLFDETWQQKLA